MPLPQFREVLGDPTFKTLPVEGQKAATRDYWAQYAQENPQEAEFATKQEKQVQSLIDVRSKLRDTDPITKKVLSFQEDSLVTRLALTDAAREGKFETKEQYEQVTQAEETRLQASKKEIDDLYSTIDVNDTEAERRGSIANLFGGASAKKMAGQSTGSIEGSKDFLNEWSDVSSGVAEALYHSDGDIDKAIEWSNKRATEEKALVEESRKALKYGPMDAGSKGAMLASSVQEYAAANRYGANAVQRLTEMREAMTAQGIPPEEQKRIIKDTATATAWTKNDKDDLRTLSTGELAINPSSLFGDPDSLREKIDSAETTTAQKDLAKFKLEVMRRDSAKTLFSQIYKYDGGFKKWVENERKEGRATGNSAEILDQWAKKQKDRSWFFKAPDAVVTGTKQASLGVTKTFVGTGASIASLWGGGEDAAEVQKILGEGQSGMGQASEFRGITGGYALTQELTDTVLEMAPMFAGGSVGSAVKGISGSAIKGMSVYGYVAAQGYESKLSDAIAIKEKELGRSLSPAEAADLMSSPQVQLAALANGAQTVLLSKLLGGGPERAALQKASKSMTVRDFMSRGGREALKDSTLRKELGKMAKTVLKDAGDEFVEEGLNQALDKMISVAAFGEDVKLGDLLAESLYAGTLGAFVGGGIPQVQVSDLTISTTHDKTTDELRTEADRVAAELAALQATSEENLPPFEAEGGTEPSPSDAGLAPSGKLPALTRTEFEQQVAEERQRIENASAEIKDQDGTVIQQARARTAEEFEQLKKLDGDLDEVAQRFGVELMEETTTTEVSDTTPVESPVDDTSVPVQKIAETPTGQVEPTQQPVEGKQNIPASSPTPVVPEAVPDESPEVAEIKQRYDQYKESLKERLASGIIDRATYNKDNKALGYQRAAELRKATGELTPKEAKTKQLRDASNYTGKSVTVDGRPATVVSTPFGRVKVSYPDGTTAVVNQNQIRPANTKAPASKKTAPTQPKRKDVKSDVIPPRKQFVAKAAAKVTEVVSAPRESATGATFNADGTVYEGGGLVVPGGSKNLTTKTMSADSVYDFMQEQLAKASNPETVKFGIYKFPNSDQVSVDVNIVVNPKNRTQALAVGKALGQKSLFDLDTFTEVDTGADGSNPRELTDAEFAELATALREGRIPDFLAEEAETENVTDEEQATPETVIDILNELVGVEFEGEQDAAVPVEEETLNQLAEPAPKELTTASPEADGSRVGTAKLGTKRVPVETPQDANIGGTRVPEKVLRAQTTKLSNRRSYPHLPDSIRRLRNPENFRKAFTGWLKDNLVALYKAFPEEVRVRATFWYDGANRMAKAMATRYGISNEQVSAVIAVLSPQKDWFMNMAQAEQVLDIWHNHQNTTLTPELTDDTINDIVESAQAPVKQLKGKSASEKAKLNEEARAKRRQQLQPLIGKRISEITDPLDQAWAIRVLAQAIHGRSYRVISPEGDYMDVATKGDGTPQINGWGSAMEIQKAVRVIQDGSLKNISDNLGEKHKVRSFYNNIVAPRSAQGDVTIDTHAVAAAHLMPYGASATPVKHNFGEAFNGSAKNGVDGAYHFYADAYRQAAEEVGILPRQMQSVTWEAVRLLYPPEARRNKGVLDTALSNWNNSPDEARTAILAAELPAPAWGRPDSGGRSGRDAAAAQEEGSGPDAGGNLRTGNRPAAERGPVEPEILFQEPEGPKGSPRGFRGRTVQLTHWSHKSGITKTDPKKHGTGAAGDESLRKKAYPKLFLPRTYFGYGKYRREQGVGPNRFSTELDGNKIYDLNNDPLNLYPDSAELRKLGYAPFDRQAALTIYENRIKQAGYIGYVNTSAQAVAVFTPQALTKVDDKNTALPLAPALNQEQETTGPKGTYTPARGAAKAQIALMKSADASTGAHEWWHAMREGNFFGILTQQEIDTITEWETNGRADGVRDRDAKEKGARGWERFLFEGTKTGIAKVDAALEKLSAWMQAVYKGIKGTSLDVEISPEVRVIMEKLVARSATGGQKKAVPVALKKATSARNAAVDADLKAVGFHPIHKIAEKALGTSWAEALDIINNDPNLANEEVSSVGQMLVSELTKSPRPVTDVEQGILLHLLASKKLEYGKATKAYLEAQKRKDEWAMASALTRQQAAASQINDIALVNTLVGSEWGRAGRFRQISIAEDFSIDSMSLKLQTQGNGDKPLTDKQRDKISESQQRIAESERKRKQLETDLLKEKQARLQLELKLAEARATSEGRTAPDPTAARKRSAAPKAQSAREKLRQMGFGRTLSQDPEGTLYQARELTTEEIALFADVGAEYIADGNVDLKSFEEALLAEFGPEVAASVVPIFEAARPVAEQNAKRAEAAEIQKQITASQRRKAKLEAKILNKEFQRARRREKATSHELDQALLEERQVKQDWEAFVRAEEAKRQNLVEKLSNVVYRTASTMRTLITSFDLPPALRQGVLVTLSNPGISGQAVKAGLTAMMSPAGMVRLERMMEEMPYTALGVSQGLALAEVGGARTRREEAFQASYVDKLPGIQMSERNYTTYLNMVRTLMFNKLCADLAKTGQPTKDEAKMIAEFVNNATGRGKLGPFELSGKALATVFFAPRYAMSRLRYVAGAFRVLAEAATFFQFNAPETRRARKLIAREYGKTAVGAATVYALYTALKVALGEDDEDDQIEQDPTKYDFGMLKIDGIGRDFFGGILQASIFMYRMAHSSRKGATGQLEESGSSRVQNTWDITSRFVRGKLSPAFGMYYDVTGGENIVRDKVTPGSALVSSFIPLPMRDIAEIVKRDRDPRAEALDIALVLFGMRYADYDDSLSLEQKTAIKLGLAKEADFKR